LAGDSTMTSALPMAGPFAHQSFVPFGPHG
jgi:hypothetical protein